MVLILGAQITPIQSHRLDLWYAYTRWADSTLIENQARAIAGVAANFSIDESLYHNIGAKWTWTLNRHFNVQFTGNLVLPGDGMKDIAKTVDCSGGDLTPADAGFRACDGEDIGLAGEIQFVSHF